jgi:hypothetical protein
LSNVNLPLRHLSPEPKAHLLFCSQIHCTETTTLLNSLAPGRKIPPLPHPTTEARRPSRSGGARDPPLRPPTRRYRCGAAPAQCLPSAGKGSPSSALLGSFFVFFPSREKSNPARSPSPRLLVDPVDRADGPSRRTARVHPTTCSRADFPGTPKLLLLPRSRISTARSGLFPELLSGFDQTPRSLFSSALCSARENLAWCCFVVVQFYL